MFDYELERFIQSLIKENPTKRILPFSYKGKDYYLKRCLSNKRNRFVKQDTKTSYLTEVYKISAVNERLPLAPHVVLEGEDYFVMETCGRPLQRVVHEFPDMVDEAYTKAGAALASLHAHGLHHGRPALRDVSWNPESHAITFLDWENESHFFSIDARVLDLFLFIHGYFREKWPTTDLLDKAIDGYCSVAGQAQRFYELRRFIDSHSIAFSICRILARFGWVDLVGVRNTEDYVRTLCKKLAAADETPAAE